MICGHIVERITAGIVVIEVGQRSHRPAVYEDVRNPVACVRRGDEGLARSARNAGTARWTNRAARLRRRVNRVRPRMPVSLLGVVGGSFNGSAALLYVLSRAPERVAAERSDACQCAYHQRHDQCSGRLHVDVPFTPELARGIVPPVDNSSKEPDSPGSFDEVLTPTRQSIPR